MNENSGLVLRRHIALDEETNANLEAEARAAKMSVSQYLRVVFSTPLNLDDTLDQVRRRVRDRLEAVRRGPR